jgi:hypothetical protein
VGEVGDGIEANGQFFSQNELMNRLGENRKIGESVEDSDDLIKGLGQARELDKPVIGNVISPYASRIAKLKDETLGLKALVKSLSCCSDSSNSWSIIK